MKKLSKILMIAATALLTSSLFTGCSSMMSVNIPIKKEVGQLNLETEPLKQQQFTDKVIAIVDPQFTYKVNQVNPQSQINPLFGYRYRLSRYVFSPTKYFQKTYEQRLAKALETELENILIKKGFKIKGPYTTFDDITYQDKKTIYLALIPKINLDIKKVSTEKKCETLYCTEKGKIMFGGDVIITLEEPLTGQIFMKKRINLSDANIVEPYIYQYQIATSTGDLVQDTLAKASVPKQLIDNRDKAMADGINKFYKYAVAKIRKYLDREEILSYQKDVEKLKNLKRY